MSTSRSTCPYCHASNRRGAQHCARCGALLAAQATPPQPTARSSASAPGEQEITLPEALLLLALDDERGDVHSAASSVYQYALAGGICGELLLRGLIELDGSTKALVQPQHAGATGQPLLDEALEQIRAAGRRKRLQRWVAKFVKLRDLRDRVAERLCARGVLESREGRYLWLFPWRRFPMVDPRAEYAILDRLRAAIYDGATVDDRTLMLLGLARGANLLSIRFPDKDLRARKRALDTLLEGSDVANATREAIQAMQAAVMAAASSAAVTAAVASG